MRKLLESLELEILSVIEAANVLRESPEFELHKLIAKNPEMFESVIEKQTGQVATEISDLKTETARLGSEIEELAGEAAPGLG